MATRTAPAVDYGRDLLEAKLSVPEPRLGTVSRTALLHRLETAMEPVVTIVAPAGYGKSTLLAQWAANGSRPVAWVTCDRRDNDAMALLTYIVAALDRIEPARADLAAVLASPTVSIWSTVVPRVGSMLATRVTPFVLVLDDAHTLDSRDVGDVVMVLSQHLPPGSTLVLAGRADPRPEVARLRVGGRQMELTAKDLALSDHEAAAMFDEAGMSLTPDEAQLLSQNAEGWAAGLYLATLALRATDQGPGPSVAQFAGDDRFVTDYVRAEHLARLPDATLEFLLRSSGLERLCASLCDAVLERDDSGRMLESIERDNLFLIPLDRTRTWYRYHRLFRDALRAELRVRDPAAAAALDLRAADWCEAHGLPDSAMMYAESAGDIARVGRLVAMHSLAFYRLGRAATVSTWFARFDDPELLAQHPMVATLGAWLFALRGQANDAERWADTLERSSYDGPMPDGSTSIRAWSATVNAALCRRGLAQMRLDAELALSELGPQSPWRAPALLMAGVASLHSGEIDRAEAELVETVAIAAASGAIYAGIAARAELALIAMEAGDQERADAHIRQALELIDGERLSDYTPTAILSAAAARSRLHHGDRDGARALLTQAQRVRPELTHALPCFAVEARLELGRVHLALGDRAGANTLVLEMLEILSRRPNLGLLGDRARQLRHQIALADERTDAWASTLTAAELRLLPLLTTHLTFREIGERLYVTRNTVKTQAISIYRKLGASSRGEAITRAAEAGLVDGATIAQRDFTPSA